MAADLLDESTHVLCSRPLHATDTLVVDFDDAGLAILPMLLPRFRQTV